MTARESQKARAICWCELLFKHLPEQASLVGVQVAIDDGLDLLKGDVWVTTNLELELVDAEER